MVKVIGEVEKEMLVSNSAKLPFTHGIECELQITMTNGKWLAGSQMKNIFREILVNSQAVLQDIFDQGQVPV